MEASLCLEAKEEQQWPRVFSLGRPRSCGLMPSLVGRDSGQVLGVLDWALTRICNRPYPGGVASRLATVTYVVMVMPILYDNSLSPNNSNLKYESYSCHSP